MQPPLYGTRSNLTRAQIRSLLQTSSSVEISYGVDLLDENFGLIADGAKYVTGGTIKSDSLNNTAHRTCDLEIDSDIVDLGWDYAYGYVKPYQVFTDTSTGISARFNLGVYTLTTPSNPLAVLPANLKMAGYDLLYLLNQPIGDSYEVTAGSDPAQAAADAILRAIPGVRVLVAPSGSTLPNQVTWPFDASKPYLWYDVVFELLRAIGYRGVWVDWDGQFHVEPFVDLQTVTPEWPFDAAAADSIVASGRTQEIDLFNVPNWFRFVMANATSTPVEGVTQYTWEDFSPDNPGSLYRRKGRYKRHVESVTCASYDDLVLYSRGRIDQLLNPTETFIVPTQPFPLAWHFDVIQFDEPHLDGGGRRVVATGWEIPLDGQSDMTWTWRTVTAQTSLLGLSVG